MPLARDQGIEDRFKYTYWEEADLAGKMSETATTTTPFLGEEDHRMLLGTVKGRIDVHKGHLILIQTKMFTHISETES